MRYIHGISLGPMRLIFVELSLHIILHISILLLCDWYQLRDIGIAALEEKRPSEILKESKSNYFTLSPMRPPNLSFRPPIFRSLANVLKNCPQKDFIYQFLFSIDLVISVDVQGLENVYLCFG